MKTAFILSGCMGENREVIPLSLFPFPLSSHFSFFFFSFSIQLGSMARRREKDSLPFPRWMQLSAAVAVAGVFYYFFFMYMPSSPSLSPLAVAPVVETARVLAKLDHDTDAFTQGAGAGKRDAPTAMECARFFP